MTHTRFLILFSFTMALCTGIPTAAQITVGRNIQVSREREGAMHNEVLIATDPTDEKRLIACSMIGPSSGGKWITGVYASFDRGVTWSPVLTEEQRINNADPACVFGLNDYAYFATISATRDSTNLQLLKVYYSKDAGKSWVESKLPTGSTDKIDREFLVVDNTNSKYRGRVYIYAQLPSHGLDDTFSRGIALFRSLDGGRTYERSVQRASPERNSSLIPGNAVVLSDGTLVALFAQLALDERNDGYPGGEPKPASQPNANIKVITSSSGGDALEKLMDVSDMYADWRQQVVGMSPRLAADVSTTTFRDRLYAVWADGRFGGRTQIVLSYSTDKGETWSKPRLVNDDRLPRRGDLEHCAAMPAVAVNKDGIVGVSWYDRRNSMNDVDYYVRFAASFDGGETFTKSVRVSEQPRVFDKGEVWPIKGLAPYNPGAARLLMVRDEWLVSGDTADLATDINGVFHSLWIDNRTGIRQIWTAAVTVQGGALKHGDPDLAKLDDVTSKVKIEVTDSSYDRTKNEGTLTIRLKNTSNDMIVGPVKLRALVVNSELGVAQILNADNGATGDGAVWDFTGLLKNGSLPPASVTGVKSLAFRLTDFGPFRQQNGSYKWIFLDLDGVVLGSIQSEKSLGIPNN